MDLGMGEILLVLLFALLLYGGRLPEVARSLGKAIGTVRQNLLSAQAEVTRGVDDAVAGVEDEERPRTVRRAPAPADLATEDVSGEPPPAPPPTTAPSAAAPRGPGPDDAPAA